MTSLKSGGRMADGETNPMRVDTSLLQGITAANQAAKATSSSLKSTGTTTSFSSQLKSATEKETTKPVEGQNYAEILTGPRAGMYVNTGGGARDGEAFVLVKHETAARTTSTAPARTARSSRVGGEKSGVDVQDRRRRTPTSREGSGGRDDQAGRGSRLPDILTGSRKGLYLNTSGNVRDGQAFVLVKRDGREYHIYGTGKDREIFGLNDKPEEDGDRADRRRRRTRPPRRTRRNTGTHVPTGPLVTDNPS